MAGVAIESTDTLEAILKVFSVPEHNVAGVVERDEEFVISSDIASGPDAAANDITVAGDVILAAKVGITHPALKYSEDGVDSLALDEASTSLRSNVNITSSFAASKSGATHSAWGLPQVRDCSLTLDEASLSRRSNVSKISIFAASKSGVGVSLSAEGLLQDRDDSLAPGQASRLRRSNVSKNSRFATSTSGAILSARGLLHDSDDSRALDEASFSRQSNIGKISTLAACKSGATLSAQGLVQDEHDSRALDQASLSRRSNVNKIPRFAASKSGAMLSAGGVPQGEDDSLALDQASSSRQSNVNNFALYTASTSHVTEVAASTSHLTDVAASKVDVTDVDGGQFTYGSTSHEQKLRSYQCHIACKDASDMGSGSLTSSSNMLLHTTPVPRTTELRATQRTTVVLQNIPKNYNTNRVVNLLDSLGYKGMFDFVDVPRPRVQRATGGFAIVNLMHPAYAPFFWKTFDGFTQWTCKSKNTCRVVWYEQLQGLHEILHRYKNLIEVRKGMPKKAKPWLLIEGQWLSFPGAAT